MKRQVIMMKKAVLVLIALVFSTAIFASDITKAFKYLNTGDYPNAQKFLIEAINDEPDNAAANYGMAKFFFLKDNKAYNVDSANLYIKRSASKIPLNPDDKQTKKYLAVGVRDYTIQALAQEINQAAFDVAEKKNTVESYQFFISNYTDKGLKNRATDSRNQLAFIRARGKNDAAALGQFINTYPDAAQMNEAKELYEKLLYEQTTADKSYLSYKKYIEQYPIGLYVAEARTNFNIKVLEYYNTKHTLDGYKEFELVYKDHPSLHVVLDSIYKLVTASGTVESFKNFVRNYKANPNVSDAWAQLYTLYTANGTDDVYRKFADEFPDFPDKDRLHKDIDMAKLELKPFQSGGKWGYALLAATKDSLVTLIPCEYEEAFEFKNGLAAVRSKPCDSRCYYYYIDRANRRAIMKYFNYAGNFDGGYAIVGIGNCEEDSCKYGIIDKRGEWAIAPEYDELDDQSEGLYLVSKNDKYGFIDQKGNAVISIKYSNAVAFSQGVAAVALDSNWFFIDKTGKQLFLDFFHDVSSFKDSVCAATKDGENWGYIDATGAFVIPAIYESAEDFEGGFGIVSKKEKDLQHKGLFISQRYKIDKKGKVIEKLTAPKEPKKTLIKKKRGGK